MEDLQQNPSWLKIKECKVTITRDLANKENGKLIDILNIHDSIMKDRQNEIFEQFYMSIVYKQMFKGLHTHPHKIDTIHCVHGKICLVIYPEIISKEDVESVKIDINKFILMGLGEGNHKTVSFPSKYPHGFFGINETSVIINYRNPAWTPEDNYQYDIKFTPIVEKLKKIYFSESH